MKISIVDGYTDEPSSLGVPPYMAPLPRYIAGAVADAGHDLDHLTIDDRRLGTDRWERALRADVLVVIASAVVPGRYLATMPLSPREASELSEHPGTTVLAGSCAAMGIRSRGRGPSLTPEDISGIYDHTVSTDPDAFVHGLLAGDPVERRRTIDEWDRWAVKGAGIIGARPDLDHMVVEIEAARGCARYLSGGCSFCIEPMTGEPVFRDPAAVGEEVSALMGAGARHFRLGGADIFSYRAKGIGDDERPEPDPEAVDALLRAVSSRGPSVFHLDNADPGIIAAHPGPSRRILGSIVENCTSGNVLSLGLESADPAVARANNLNASADETLEAMRAICEAGSEPGPSGLPSLLPGLNFIMGLRGETKASMEANIGFLTDVMGSGTLVRRINVRQVVWPDGKVSGSKNTFRFKAWVRENVDRPMLRRIAPGGRVLRNVYTEVRIGKVVYGRQPASYPLLVGLAYDVPLGRFIDAAVTTHGFRSITAVEHPLDINTAPMGALESVPGIGRKRAARLIRARPFSARGDLATALDDDDAAEGLLRYAALDWP